jgi:hypothetical protein
VERLVDTQAAALVTVTQVWSEARGKSLAPACSPSRAEVQQDRLDLFVWISSQPPTASSSPTIHSTTVERSNTSGVVALVPGAPEPNRAAGWSSPDAVNVRVIRASIDFGR